MYAYAVFEPLGLLPNTSPISFPSAGLVDADIAVEPLIVILNCEPTLPESAIVNVEPLFDVPSPLCVWNIVDIKLTDEPLLITA